MEILMKINENLQCVLTVDCNQGVFFKVFKFSNWSITTLVPLLRKFAAFWLTVFQFRQAGSAYWIFLLLSLSQESLLIHENFAKKRSKDERSFEQKF